jgi:hypothetical protein
MTCVFKVKKKFRKEGSCTSEASAVLYQNNSLMFQFIMAEFIQASHQIQLLDLSLPQLHQGVVQEVEKLIHSLAGASHDYMRFFSWNTQEGILSKLKGYTALFASNNKNNKHGLLEKFANDAWKTSVESLDILYLIRQEKDDMLLLGEALYRKLDVLKTVFKKFGKLVAELILEFSQDENVLFFILKQKSKLEDIYGIGFVKRIFAEMYPEDILKVKHFLKKQYLQRGFGNLLGSISEKCSQLLN